MLFGSLRLRQAQITALLKYITGLNRMQAKRKKFTSAMLVPSTISIEVFSNGTSYMAPSLMLRTELRTYLFNCPEGLSRFIPSMRVRPNQLQDVFITKDIWENVSGIFGLIMGKDELVDEDFRIHGPQKICQFIQYMKPTSEEMKEQFPVNLKECDNKCDHYEDSAIRVDYLQVSNKLDKKYIQNGVNSKSSLPMEASITNVAYLVELKKRPPHIDPLKLIQLKLPRTSVIERLKRGETVTLDDGRVIRPDDIIDHEKMDFEFPNLLVADIATEENLESIIANPILKDYYEDNRVRQMNYIVHFGDHKIFGLDQYKEWLRLFGPKCTHLVLNGKGKFTPGSDKIYNSQNLLRQIFPQGFPELYSENQEFEGKQFDQDDEIFDLKIQTDGNVGPIIFPAQGRRFSIRGKLNKFPMDQIKLEFISGKILLEKRIEEGPEELPKKIEEFREASSNLSVENGHQYPIITFLGTGSAIPNIYRNVSANMLQTNEKSTFLIDCGEGTYGQMKALFGPEELERQLTNLHAIFITHHHVDHFLGFFKILQKRMEAFKKLEFPYKQLAVVCNYNFIQLCDKFGKEFVDIRPYVSFVNWTKHISQNSDAKLIEQKKGFANLEEYMRGDLFALNEWNIRQIRALQVIHKNWSCAFVFTTELEKRKIVFSGDTKPSENLEWHGKDADLLVHECTLEDGMEIDANRKKHSTMRQAFDSAERMLAKNVILTHFSMRYHQVPPLPDYLIEAGNFSCAKDNMVVPFEYLPLFHKLLPVYRSLYSEEQQEMNKKKITRNFVERKVKNEENKINERRKIRQN